MRLEKYIDRDTRGLSKAINNMKNFLVYDCTKPIVDKYPERIIKIIRKQEKI